MPYQAELRKRGEKEIAALMSRLNERQLRELTRAMGTPPDIRRVPEALWQKFENEIYSSLAALLLLLYSDSALKFEGLVRKKHGRDLKEDTKQPDFDGRLPDDRRESLAKAYAEARAKEFSRDYVQHTRQKLSDAGESLRQAGSELNSQGDTVPPASAVEKFDIRLQTVLGDRRAEGVGDVETRKAITAGEDGYAGEVADYSNYVLVAIWSHEPTSKPHHANSSNEPCPVCTPLVGKKQYEWPPEFMTGPPAHPRCDCHLEYELITREEAEEIGLGPAAMKRGRSLQPDVVLDKQSQREVRRIGRE